MSPRRRQLAAVAVITWAFALIVLLILRYEVSRIISLTIEVIIGVLGVAAVALSARVLVSRRSLRAALPLVVAAALWLAWLLAPVHLLGIYARAFREMSSYEVAAKEFVETNKPGCLRQRRCLVDSGPPARLAFPWEHYMDGMYGIVFDPSGSILDNAEQKLLFGGYLVDARHLWGSWYFCAFT